MGGPPPPQPITNNTTYDPLCHAIAFTVEWTMSSHIMPVSDSCEISKKMLELIKTGKIWSFSS